MPPNAAWVDASVTCPLISPPAVAAAAVDAANAPSAIRIAALSHHRPFADLCTMGSAIPRGPRQAPRDDPRRDLGHSPGRDGAAACERQHPVAARRRMDEPRRAVV